jgi:hypothetical protein
MTTKKDLLEAQDLFGRARPGTPCPEGLEAILDALAVAYDEMSHERSCPYRHSGPCLCLRGELAEMLSAHGRGL